MRGVDFTEERIELFPTRFVRRQYDGLERFNRGLTQRVLEREAAAQGETVLRSNVGGWHSDSDLLRWDAPEITVLIELMQSVVAEAVGLELRKDPGTFALNLHMDAWANVSRSGHYARPHVHPLANFAVVYYPDVGDGGDTPAGCLEFLDPRTRVTMMNTPGVSGQDSVCVRPRTGMMLCFPAWIYHYVHPYDGTRPRVSVAANVTVRGVQDKAPVQRPDAAIFEA
ncbi:MAG: TIGR02466 family protein [Myxococcota bacterium]